MVPCGSDYIPQQRPNRGGLGIPPPGRRSARQRSLSFGRKQDLAFEQPVGDSPRQRHHVRFWRSEEQESGRPLWLGAATFDERVGLSYTTGEVTHHIGPDVDAERNRIANELEKADWAQEVYWIDGFHHRLEGHNGGGDPWRTDGRLAVVVLKDGSDVPQQDKR